MCPLSAAIVATSVHFPDRRLARGPRFTHGPTCTGNCLNDLLLSSCMLEPFLCGIKPKHWHLSFLLGVGAGWEHASGSLPGPAGEADVRKVGCSDPLHGRRSGAHFSPTSGTFNRNASPLKASPTGSTLWRGVSPMSVTEMPPPARVLLAHAHARGRSEPDSGSRGADHPASRTNAVCTLSTTQRPPTRAGGAPCPPLSASLMLANALTASPSTGPQAWPPSRSWPRRQCARRWTWR